MNNTFIRKIAEQVSKDLTDNMFNELRKEKCTCGQLELSIYMHEHDCGYKNFILDVIRDIV